MPIPLIENSIQCAYAKPKEQVPTTAVSLVSTIPASRMSSKRKRHQDISRSAKRPVTRSTWNITAIGSSRGEHAALPPSGWDRDQVQLWRCTVRTFGNECKAIVEEFPPKTYKEFRPHTCDPKTGDYENKLRLYAEIKQKAKEKTPQTKKTPMSMYLA